MEGGTDLCELYIADKPMTHQHLKWVVDSV
jgi:hypothetical protein